MMLWPRQCRNNGITYLFSLYYSTAAAAATSRNNLLAEILVNSLGFSTEKAISTSAKVTFLKPGNNKPLLVINFLQQLGLDKTHIKTLVSSNPKLLFSDVDKTLKPKIKVFQELGLSGSDLAEAIAKSGPFFHLSLDNSIRPNLDYLGKLLGSDDSVAKFIKKEPRFLWGINALKLMPPNVALLQNFGLSRLDIQKLLFRYPRYLIQKPEWIKCVLHRVEKDLCIPRGSTMFLCGIYAVGALSESSLQMKLEIFRSFGWSDKDILTMAQKLPNCLTTSEVKLKDMLKYYMKELGYESSYVASHPSLLIYSLEKKVIPRNEVFKFLKEKQLKRGTRSLWSVLVCSESKILERYVLPFKDKMPEVYDLYIKSRM